MSRHVAAIAISLEALLQMIVVQNVSNRLMGRAASIPLDAVPLNAAVDPLTGIIWFFLEHPSFTEVPEGTVAPLLNSYYGTKP